VIRTRTLMASIAYSTWNRRPSGLKVFTPLSYSLLVRNMLAGCWERGRWEGKERAAADELLELLAPVAIRGRSGGGGASGCCFNVVGWAAGARAPGGGQRSDRARLQVVASGDGVQWRGVDVRPSTTRARPRVSP
jgi:hypothetical protein